MAHSLALPQRPALQQSIVELLRERGNRLLGTREIFERLNDTDVTREQSDRAVEELERDGIIVAVRGRRFSLLEFTPYHAGSVRIYNDGHGSVLGAPDEPEIYIDRKSLQGAMNGDLVVVRIEKKNPRIRTVKNREYIDGEVIRILSPASTCRRCRGTISR